MIIQRFLLKDYDWKVAVLYNVTFKDVNIVHTILKEICNNDKIVYRSTRYIERGKLNTGFIYSNFNIKSSVIVIGEAESKQEFINTIAHEANHLQSHIATVFNINEKGEEVCYLIGNIVERMYKVFSKIICK